MERKPKEDDDMSKEDIMAFIDAIDEQLKKNKEIIDAYADKQGDSNILTLNVLTQNLVIAKKTGVDMLLYEHGVFYVG